MRLETVRELAERNGVATPAGLSPEGWRFGGFLDFIDQYIELCDLMTDLEDFRRLGLEVCEDLEANGVRYAEAVFTPSAHAAAFGDDWTSPLEAAARRTGGRRPRSRHHRAGHTRRRARPGTRRGRAHARGRSEVRGRRRGGAELCRQRTERDRARSPTSSGRPSVRACGRCPMPVSGRARERLADARALPARSHRARRAIDRRSAARRPPGERRHPARGGADLECRDGRVPIARGTSVPSAARCRRHRDPELRRPVDVRRMAHRRL